MLFNEKKIPIPINTMYDNWIKSNFDKNDIKEINLLSDKLKYHILKKKCYSKNMNDLDIFIMSSKFYKNKIKRYDEHVSKISGIHICEYCQQEI